ncbi:MAG: hypothetical protein HQL52_14920 [Magnetococcales bacterium]|nr:hypothetical protein [Magnetococcales bacterium]
MADENPKGVAGGGVAGAADSEAVVDAEGNVGYLDNRGPKKGVIFKIFGVIMIFLGGMDSLLFWRGGMAATDGYLLLIIIGFALYAIGAIRGRYQESEEAEADA